MSSDQPRAHRPFWADLRFVIGVLLVVVSVSGVWLVVSASRQTSTIFAASSTLVPGQTVTRADLVEVEVALGSAQDAYLGAGSLVEDAVADRVISAGELVPATALVPARDVEQTTVVIQSSADVPASVEAGAGVELWSAPRLEQGRFDVPRILVADAVVVSVERDDSPLGSVRAAVELVIPRAAVPDTLAAVADGAAMSIVPWGTSR